MIYIMYEAVVSMKCCLLHVFLEVQLQWGGSLSAFCQLLSVLSSDRVAQCLPGSGEWLGCFSHRNKESNISLAWDTALTTLVYNLTFACQRDCVLIVNQIYFGSVVWENCKKLGGAGRCWWMLFLESMRVYICMWCLWKWERAAIWAFHSTV